MSKFTNRNRQNSKSRDRFEKVTNSKSRKRSFYDVSKPLNLERNSQQELTQVDENPKLLDSKSVCELEELNSETRNREEAVAEEKRSILDVHSDNSSKRSPNIGSKAQIAEEVKLLIECGLKYYQQKDYRQCISNLERALNVDRENVKTNYWLGMSYYQLLQMDKALKYFIRVSPSNCESGYVETFFWIGEIYRQQQMLSEASDNYQKLLSLAPNSTYSASALEHLTTIKFRNLFG